MPKDIGKFSAWRKFWAAATVAWGVFVLGLATMNEMEDRISTRPNSSWLGSSRWSLYTKAIAQLDDAECVNALATYSRENNAASLRQFHDACPHLVYRLKMRPPISRQQAIDWLTEARAYSAFASFPATVISVILGPSLALYLVGWLTARMRR